MNSDQTLSACRLWRSGIWAFIKLIIFANNDSNASLTVRTLRIVMHLRTSIASCSWTVALRYAHVCGSESVPFGCGTIVQLRVYENKKVIFKVHYLLNSWGSRSFIHLLVYRLNSDEYLILLSHGGRAVTRSLSTHRTRVQLRAPALGRDSRSSRQNQGCSRAGAVRSAAPALVFHPERAFRYFLAIQVER